MYNVFGATTIGGHMVTAAHLMGVQCDYKAMQSDDEREVWRSMVRYNPLSEESECGEGSEWTEGIEAESAQPPACLPEKPYNSLEERSLHSLGYASLDEWPAAEGTQGRADKPPLYDLMMTLVRKRLKTNTTITIGESCLHAHLIVLQCYSGLFCDIGSNTLNVELPADWVTPRALRLIYEWMIVDGPRLSRLGLLEVLRAASFLRIVQLERQCDHCLAHGITEESAVMLYLEARLLRMERAHRSQLQRVGRFFLTLVASQEFLQLPLRALLLLLSSNGICVNSELEVFMSAVRWLNFDWPKRRLNVAQLIACVRFALVPPWLLIRLHDRQSQYVELKRIITLPEVLQRLHDGIGYTTTRLCYGADRDAFLQHLERTGMQPPQQRSWIYDGQCCYHHRLHCHIAEEFTYDTFLNYLNCLQRQHMNYWQTLEPVDASELCLSCQKEQTKSIQS
ncbi:hypothetical protein AWZ03_014675 [Drosophila navojoa]|uniref:BACK domain-containing protein n=1 Tax=Drosophila navojoa TaxID=7232 RepID=A0A484AQH1_DRONA|nr:hypothetical protein AWZ03_014675 [Drosophila navojoa]